MGRVMAEVKERHATKLDMSKASAAVKARLSFWREGGLTLSPAFLDDLRARTLCLRLLAERQAPEGRARVQGLLPVP